jgi:two-component system, NtrC family, sensor histidine kinase KinB
MTFRTKVLLAQAPFGVALVLLAILAVRTTGSIGAGAEAILKENYRSVLAAQRMQNALEALDRATLFHLAGHGELDEATVDRQIEKFGTELAVEEGNITEDGEGPAAAELHRRWDVYRGHFGALRGLDPTAAAETYFRDLAPDFLAVRQATDRILDLNQDAMLRKSDRAREQAARMGTVMIAASLGALLLGIILSSLLTNRLVQPVARLREAAHRIGAGDFSARVPVAGRDELAQLATTFNGMADRLDRYRRSSLGELLLAQQAAQSAIDSLPDPVVVFDANGGVLIVNRAGEGLLGIGLGTGAGAALAQVDPALRGVVEQARDHVLGGKGAYVPRGFEDAARMPSSSNGDEYYLARATPVYGEQGGITGATVILQDVTRLHRFDQLKNDLVSTVAHEFRTPLTSLRMAIHLCLEQFGGPLSEKQADLLYGAREDCERLQRIVDELLDLAKIQGGRMQLQRRRLAPRALVDTAIDAQHSLAAERHVELHGEVAPGLPELDVDADRIQLVFANLLTNAIRHSPDGAEVALRSRASDGAVRFEVADQGPGIPEAQREVIFEKFAQGADAPGGAGLGLSIAKEIVTAHGGHIGVDSQVGRGSTFWFTVPVR